MNEEQELNAKWNIHKVVQEAINSSHPEPAPETRERLAKLETNQQNFMDKLEENQIANEKAHERLMSSITEFHAVTNNSLKGMEEKLDRALDKKANIWVEKVLIWLGAVIGVGLIGYLGTLLVRVIEHL